AVADLVVPAAGTVAHGAEETCDFMMCCPGVWSIDQGSSFSTNANRLMARIKHTVHPKCWAEYGGPCTMEFFPVGMGLVVHAPDEVQQEVTAFLESLRKPDDAPVIEVSLRFITVSDEFIERFGLNFDMDCGPYAPRPCCHHKLCCDKDCCTRVGIDSN